MNAAATEVGPLGRRARQQGPEEWATMVHAAVAWSDVAPADDAKVPYHNKKTGGGGRAAMLMTIYLSGLALGKG